jgi:DNA ligase (NAD+)
MDDIKDIKERIGALRESLKYHIHRYYVLDAPEISDEEYDRLFAELKALEERHPELVTADSPTQRVGAAPATTFRVVRHRIPLLSLANAFNADDLTAWWRRTGNLIGNDTFDAVCEPKMDGLAVALTYVDGILATGATRGMAQRRGITNNLRTVRSIPLSVPREAPRRFEVRVRSICQGRDSAAERAQGGEGPALVRQSTQPAAGAVRQLDPSVTPERPLDIYVYGLGWAEDATLPETHWETMQWLGSLGFKINPLTTRTHTADEAQEVHEQWVAQRAGWPFEADGMVVKVDSLRLQRELGSVGREPRWAIAYKFPAVQGTTRLNDIGVSVGRTGSLNPYAILEPVRVGGVVISQQRSTTRGHP